MGKCKAVIALASFHNSSARFLRLRGVLTLVVARNFLCGVERVKPFVKVHLHCIVRNLKNDKRNVNVAHLEKFLRTPMNAPVKQ